MVGDAFYQYKKKSGSCWHTNRRSSSSSVMLLSRPTFYVIWPLQNINFVDIHRCSCSNYRKVFGLRDQWLAAHCLTWSLRLGLKALWLRTSASKKTYNLNTNNRLYGLLVFWYVDVQAVKQETGPNENKIVSPIFETMRLRCVQLYYL